MATKKKVKQVEEEITEEQPQENTVDAESEFVAEETVPTEVQFEVPLSDVMEQEGVKHPISIPDIPAQMDNSVPEEPKGETEIEFLQRILFIQEDGGFGMHLHKLINNRIKSLS